MFRILVLTGALLASCSSAPTSIQNGSYKVTVAYHSVQGDEVRDGAFPYWGNITTNAVAVNYFGFLACGTVVDTTLVNDSVYDVWGIWAVVRVTGTVNPDGTAQLHVHEQVYADDPAAPAGVSVGTPFDEDYTFSDLKPIVHGVH